MPRADFLADLEARSTCGSMAEGMDLVCAYVGARHFLVARYDFFSDNALDFVVSSDWPFNLVRSLGALLVGQQAKSSEIRRCLSAFEPSFSQAPASVILSEGLSRQVCLIPYNAGQARLVLMLLFEEGILFSHDRLRDAALACAYHTANFPGLVARSLASAELTEREVECLSWIGEGKTSDEIAMIIGISRNTVNNYITSIMNKTGARTRSEAVAFAVRNGLI